MLSPRTGLNGREQGQEQVREAKKQKEEIENPSQDQPTVATVNGGDLGRSTFLVLTFAFALAFVATFVLALILVFLLGNGEKTRILSQSGVIPFGAFGWAFARAHCDLRRRFTFHGPGSKPAYAVPASD